MTTRFIADLHLDYEEIIAYDNRPFDTIEEMNRAVIERWNRVVGPEDLTWILGDFCSGDATRWRELLGQLHGKKALITGNHDAPETVAAVSDLFEEVAPYREIQSEEGLLVLCHYPILAYRDHHLGALHLYGHVHASYDWNIVENGKRNLKKLYVHMKACRMANVGAMLPYMDYTPRTLAELKEQL